MGAARSEHLSRIAGGRGFVGEGTFSLSLTLSRGERGLAGTLRGEQLWT